MTSTNLYRTSPVSLPGRPREKETRDHWTVVLSYADEGPGPWVVDLSHCPRWDIQGKDPGTQLPQGHDAPGTPGEVSLKDGVLLARQGKGQISCWGLAPGAPVPSGPGVTETTEGTVCLALAGPDVFRITEKLTTLDLGDPARKAPLLLQGPLSHVPCQVVVIRNEPDAQVVAFTCSRGYGHDMTHAVLEAGKEFGLKPAGESAFLHCINPQK